MRGYIHEVDDKHERIVHEANASDLRALAQYCSDQRSIGAGNGKDDKLCMHADSFTIMAWCNKHGVTWPQFFNTPELQSRFVEDSDNAAFRVWQGRL